MAPFLFTRRSGAVDKLVGRLEPLNFCIIATEDSDSAYTPARMTLTTPWMGSVEILWHRRWWDDGATQEDDVVFVRCEGQEREVVNIADLLRRKLDRPLAEVVADHIVDALVRLKRPEAGGEGDP